MPRVDFGMAWSTVCRIRSATGLSWLRKASLQDFPISVKNSSVWTSSVGIGGDFRVGIGGDCDCVQSSWLFPADLWKTSFLLEPGLPCTVVSQVLCLDMRCKTRFSTRSGLDLLPNFGKEQTCFTIGVRLLATSSRKRAARLRTLPSGDSSYLVLVTPLGGSG